jgi:Protein of unknwon function (DUF3310).
MEEFYKTIEVGQKVKICGIDWNGALCEAVAVVTGLYPHGDYGFDYFFISGQAYDARGTVGHSELVSGKVTAYPYHEEDAQTTVHNDVVNSPNHYILFKDIEVKDVVKEVLRRWQDESNTAMSFNQAGMMKEALQYLLRAPKKNKKEDVEKAVYYLKAILEEWK